jgi:hypothetical protein
MKNPRFAVAIGVASALTLAWVPSAHAALNLSSTFDTDNEGWETAEFGNPEGAGWDDGAIYLVDQADPPEISAIFISPPSWSGDATNNYGGTLEFDLSTTEWSAGVAAFLIPGESEPPLCFYDETPAPVGGSFGTYTFTMDTTDARRGDCVTPASSGQVIDVMSELSSVVVLGDDPGVYGEVTSLDNVSLSGGGSPQPYDVERTLNIDHGKVSSNFLNPFFAFFGVLDADDPTCASHRKVVVYRKRKGRDEKLGTRTTNSEGFYRLAYERKKGTYYAKAPEEDLGLPTCLETVSNPFKIN